MTSRGPSGRIDGGLAVVLSLCAVLIAGVLLPWGLAEAGIRWSATQSALVAGVAIAAAIVVVGRYARRIGGIGRKRVRIASLTLVALVFATASLIALRARVDQLRGELRDATMTPSADGRVLRIEGFIGDDFVAHLDSRLADLPDLRRIDITSAGGLIDDTLIAVDRIRARSLRIRVVGECASGCVVLWASSVPREIEVSAVIGVHRTWVDPEVPEAWEPRVRGRYEARSVELLRAAGFSEALLDLRDATDPADMAVLDVVELLDHGVHAIVVDEEGVPMTPRAVRARLARAAAPARDAR